MYAEVQPLALRMLFVLCTTDLLHKHHVHYLFTLSLFISPSEIQKKCENISLYGVIALVKSMYLLCCIISQSSVGSFIAAYI